MIPLSDEITQGSCNELEEIFLFMSFADHGSERLVFGPPVGHPRWRHQPRLPLFLQTGLGVAEVSRKGSRNDRSVCPHARPPPGFRAEILAAAEFLVEPFGASLFERPSRDRRS